MRRLMKSWSSDAKRQLLLGSCLLALPGLATAADPASSPSPSPRAVPEHIATPNVFAADLRVEVKNGAVTLDGTVRDAAAKKTAEEIAQRAPGTHEVTNHLRPRESN